MKQKHVPLEKLSKREQREFFKSRRGSWGEISPVTRKPPHPKAYNRKKSGRWQEDEPPTGLFLLKSYQTATKTSYFVPSPTDPYELKNALLSAEIPPSSI